MQLIVTHPALREEYLKTAALIESELTQVIAKRIGADPQNVAWPAKSIAVQVQVALEDWLKAVDVSNPADEFPTRPQVWRLRMSLMMAGGALDLLESLPR